VNESQGAMEKGLDKKASRCRLAERVFLHRLLLQVRLIVLAKAYVCRTRKRIDLQTEAARSV